MKDLNNSFDINQFLPDSLIQDDLLKFLWGDRNECEIELDENNTIVVSRSVKLEVIVKLYRHSVYKVGFGNYFCAEVAIGGVTKVSGGIVEPLYCYATIFYSPEKEVITVDVHSDMR
jgi:hypothetical protein